MEEKDNDREREKEVRGHTNNRERRVKKQPKNKNLYNCIIATIQQYNFCDMTFEDCPKV